MTDAILLTGATGFLGMELIARQLDAGDGPDIFVAVRARDAIAARGRVDELLAALYDEPPESAERLRPIAAEMTEPDLGIARTDRFAMKGQVGRVIHCAASISFTLPLDEARAINVDGTRRMLEVARRLPRVQRVVHVSTAYVAGRTDRTYTEQEVDGNDDFRNTYERSKREAEVTVDQATDLPVAIVRPSIVVGEADSGWTSAFNVLYWPLQAFARGLLDTVPADPQAVVDMVPVDYVAEVIEQATFTPGALGRFHAVAADRALSVEQLINAVCAQLDRRPPVLSAPGTLPADHPAEPFAPYFDIKTRFDDTRARGLTGAGAPDPLFYLRELLEYGRITSWGKRPLTREAARSPARSRA